MSDAVWVLDYLQEVVGSHRFSGTGREYNRSNFECEIAGSVVLECRNGNRIAIPTGSTLVIYRDPTIRVPEQMTIACFHHVGGQAQTVVMGGGRVRTMQLGHKSVLGNFRRFRRMNNPHVE